MTKRQQIPIVPMIDEDVARAIRKGENEYRVKVLGQAPLPPHPDDIPPPASTDAISDAFARAREAVARMEAGRIEAIDPAWSVAQHVRAA